MKKAGGSVYEVASCESDFVLSLYDSSDLLHNPCKVRYLNFNEYSDLQRGAAYAGVKSVYAQYLDIFNSSIR